MEARFVPAGAVDEDPVVDVDREIAETATIECHAVAERIETLDFGGDGHL